MSLSMNRILVAVDFSETSDKAFDHALSLARAFEAELLAIHVLEEPILYAPTTAQVYRDEFEKTMQGRMDELLARHSGEGVEIRTLLKPGPPFLEVIRTAEAENCDMIVMGTHGHGPVQNMLMGSVAEKVVRKAKCPVLVVRPDQHDFVHP